MLKPGGHIHLMGICGTAMASLAGIFHSQGYKVTGSDQNVYPPMSTQLQSLGIPIMEGYGPENLKPRPDLVIVGNVISKTNPEAAALLATDIPYTSLPKALGQFVIGQRHSLVVAGTHGKTTTTSLLATVMDRVAPGIGYLIGGIPVNFGQSFRAPSNDWFVIEGDEYDTAFFDKVPKFTHYQPRSAILTGIEFDHADIYKDLDDVKRAFRKLLEILPADGLLVASGDDPNVKELLPFTKARTVTYGLDPACTYRLVDRAPFQGRNQFSVLKTPVGHSAAAGRSARVADIAIKSPGEHNALNALAVYALASELKLPEAKILQGLADFKGVKRRQEILGEPGGVRVIEDFAHHPTAVDKTLQAIREQFVPSGQKLFALFEPRSATSRRKIFQKDYARAFAHADTVLIAEAFDQSKIDEAERFSSQDLVRDLNNQGQKAEVFGNVDDMVRVIKKMAKAGDTVLVMSNGAFGGIYQKLLTVLSP
jgi:UDP-N-acetylmuramate: L-alanyl-gamma-D-glutamyl-meso-diaminopimelate ligase